MPATRQNRANIRAAALDRTPINGLTHRFYRYPARFSPAFAAACIEAYSKPGDVVLDPYMGGGTTPLEALVLGRQAIGSDINSLAVFIASVKVTTLSKRDQQALVRWATTTVPRLKCSDQFVEPASDFSRNPRNMTLPSTRWLKKMISLCLETLKTSLPSDAAVRFARCVLLNVGQWALNGRKRIPIAQHFRDQIANTTFEMLGGVKELAGVMEERHLGKLQPVLRENDAEVLHMDRAIQDVGPADLVVTSPPYPGVHMLYHRWQVDGRKETDAPYWIAACQDGGGAAHYNFADRRPAAEDRYYEKAERSFAAVRKVVRPGAVMVQLIAFSDPERQLRRYLRVMEQAGFQEDRAQNGRRTWRDVPSRRWHANLKGQLSSSREVVLVHVAD